MNPASIALFAALLVVGAGVVIAAAKSTSFLRKGDRIWLIGDSIGVGLLRPLSELVQSRGLVIAGAPVGGTTVGSWDSQPDSMLISPAKQWGASVVVVVLGTNDAAASEQYRDTVSRTSAMLTERFNSAGMRVCWVGPGSDMKFSEGGREVQTMVAASSGAQLVLDPTTQKIPKQPDNVHPTASGYSQMAKWIWDRISGS